jgi:hypothetical protein
MNSAENDASKTNQKEVILLDEIEYEVMTKNVLNISCSFYVKIELSGKCFVWFGY